MGKLCPDCGELKEAGQFYKNRSARDGLNSYCKPCWAVRAKAQRQKTKLREVSADPKVCGACGELRSSGEFYKDMTRADHLSPSCKSCIKRDRLSYYERNKDQIKARVAAYQKANPEVQARSVAKRRANGKRRLADVRQRYGVSEEQYAEMMERAGGVCEICGRVPSEVSKKGACVDHCHDSGKVRGILCAPCNAGIGSLQDDPAVLRRAIEYLETHSVHNVIE